MKRTARLVRLALEGRAPAPEPWLRGGADVAAAVAKSGANSRREGAPAAGGRGGGIPSRDPSHTAGAPSGGPGRQFAHAAGGPGVFSSRDLANAAGGPGAISPLHVAHAAGVPAAISPSDIIRAAGGPGDIPHAAGGAVGVARARNLSHDAGGVSVGSVRDLATPCPGSGHEGTSSVMKKGKGGGGVVQADGDHYSLQGGQGGRGATEDLQQGKGGHGAHVESKATAGPGCGIALSTSLPVDGSDTHRPDSSPSKVRPLVIHDRIFISCEEVKGCGLLSGAEEEWATNLDVSDRISSYLTQSVGPISSFRIDSSTWPTWKCLENWLELVSQKSVEDLEVLNLGYPVDSRFPLETLQNNNLENLRLGFFDLALDLHCFNYNSLQTLEFFCCSLEGRKLSWVVTECPVLKELKVHHCIAELRISSKTLQNLDCFGIIGNRLVIESTPNLQSLSFGIVANQKCAVARQRILAAVYLNNVPNLKFMKQLNLPCNKIIVNTKEITKDVVPLPSVVRLCLSLDMSNSIQLQHLRKVLESFPVLKSLSVTRMDSIGRDEGFNTRIDEPFVDIGTIDCVKNFLAVFSLQGFHGGASEEHLIKSVLKNAPNLVQLYITCSANASKKAIRDALGEIKTCDLASEICQFSFQ